MCKRVRFFVLILLLMALSTVSETVMSQNNTIPRPEYPRPDFARDQWLNLNGTWSFRIDPGDAGVMQNWFLPESDEIKGQIVVPFPWQSELSGVQNLLHRGVAWYRRGFTVPDGWQGQRVVLHFGAVDYWARVWVNGQPVGEHEGGYTPFEFDITDALQPGDNVLVVRVDDPADQREIPHGKQKSLPPNPWDDVSFTTTSGIWQTVWLEARPADYITSARITPDVAGEQAVLAVEVYAAAPGMWTLTVNVIAPDGTALPALTVTVEAAAAGMQTLRFDVPVPTPLLWDIRQPNLYNVTLNWASGGAPGDTVQTYFGMRSIETRGQQVLLNGRPVYLMSALDQGYWPDGLYTAPSDDALRYDIEYALRVGFNGLRKHIKIEDPRFAYWADQLGLLLWCDAPSPVTFSQLAQERLKHDLKGMIERDFNHPSIVVWSPYNESWGLEFRSNKDVREYLAALYDEIKTWDPTRLVVDNSGWRHVKTDIADSHKYTGDPVEWRGFMTLLANDPMVLEVLGHPFYATTLKYDGVPIMITEYATGWREDRSWGFKWQTDEIRRHANVSGYTYTELYDIEHEFAGFMLYDRTPKDFGYDPAMINSPDYITLHHTEPRQLTPDTPLSVEVYISAYGLPELTGGALRWRFEPVSPDDQPTPLAQGEETITLTPYTVTQVNPIELQVPTYTGAAKLWAEVIDDAGTVRAYNYLDFEVMGDPLPVRETQADGDSTRYVYRMPLAEADGAFSPLGPLATPRFKDSEVRPVLIGRDSGYVEFRAPLPENGAWQSVQVEAEVASLPSANFVTMALEGQGYPTTVQVYVNGVQLGVWQVPDRPVNALGALNIMNQLGPGEHGFWMRLALDTPDVVAAIEQVARRDGELVVRFEVPKDADDTGGMTLFGQRAGRYGRDPMLSIVTK